MCHQKRTVKKIESCDIPSRTDSRIQTGAKLNMKAAVGLDERMSLMLPDIEAKESSFSADVLEAVQEIQQERDNGTCLRSKKRERETERAI